MYIYQQLIQMFRKTLYNKTIDISNNYNHSKINININNNN